MIIDRTWNKTTQNYVISYVGENGERKIWNKYMHHWKTWEYDANGSDETWDGKKCSKVFKNAADYKPNEFDELEFLYELEKTEPELLKLFHTSYVPKTYVFDIETQYIEGEFPDPAKAEHEIVSVSIVGPDLSCIVYGFHDLTKEQYDLLSKHYLDWIHKNTYAHQLLEGKPDPKFFYQKCDNEEMMLKYLFKRVFPKITCLTGWNTNNFDFQYITNRLIRLFGKYEALSLIKKCSPTGELNYMRVDDGFGNKFSIPTPKHTLWLDEMQLVKDYDYAFRPYESFSLDYVGEKVVKANKIKYQGSLKQLYERDYEWYYFYNAIDSLIVMLIHHRLKCIESPIAVGSLTLVPLLKAFGQVALTTANIFNEFYLDGKHVVYEQKHNVKIPYEGAFCACVSGLTHYNVCSDFASLYPSTVITCNFSFENYVKNLVGPDSFGRYTDMGWSEKELEELRKDPNYFVSVMGHVYKNDKDYAFRRLMKKLLGNRKYFKYTGNQIEAELQPYIDKLITKRKIKEYAAK